MSSGMEAENKRMDAVDAELDMQYARAHGGKVNGKRRVHYLETITPSGKVITACGRKLRGYAGGGTKPVNCARCVAARQLHAIQFEGRDNGDES